MPAGWTVIEATFCQVVEPPVSVGSDGGTVSIAAVAAGSTAAGAHAEAFPALSSARNCTHVVPLAVILALAPATAALQDVPPFDELRCW